MDLTDRLLALRDGAVIQWVMHGHFQYVAIKVRGAWYTSATEGNTSLGKIVNSHELAYAMHKDTAYPAVEVVQTWALL